MDFSSVQARCGSKDNIKHIPGGGKVCGPEHHIFGLFMFHSSASILRYKEIKDPQFQAAYLL